MRSKGGEQPAWALQGGQGSYCSRHAGGLAPCKPIFRHASVSSTYSNTRVSDIMGWRLDLIYKQTHATRLLLWLTALVQGAGDVHR